MKRRSVVEDHVRLLQPNGIVKKLRNEGASETSLSDMGLIEFPTIGRDGFDPQVGEVEEGNVYEKPRDIGAV